MNWFLRRIEVTGRLDLETHGRTPPHPGTMGITVQLDYGIFWGHVLQHI